MSKKNNDNKGKRFRMPYGQIAFWSFVIMIIAFFVSPAIFWPSLFTLGISLGLGLGRLVSEDNSSIPIWWGGL